MASDWRKYTERLIGGPKLSLTFGSSCKPLATLRCEDVHSGPMRRGSRLCCAVCHKSGCDHLTARHTKPGDGQIRPDYPALATNYHPGPLKGGK